MTAQTMFSAGPKNGGQHSRVKRAELDNERLEFGRVENYRLDIDGLYQYSLTLCCLEYTLLTASVLL